MKKILLLGAAVLVMQAIPALAEDGPKGKGMERMFEMQDANKDGSISEEEYLNFGKTRFSETDADKDGKITKDEIRAHREAMREKWKEKREEREEHEGKMDDSKKPDPKPPVAE